MKDLEKLMAKKPEGKMDKAAVQAKMDVIQELLEMAQEAMAGRVKGGMDEMQKVSVMAPDKESLSEGLDMAQMLAGDESEDEEESSDEMPEASSEESSESEESPMMSIEAAQDEEDEEVSPFMKKSADMKKSGKKLFSMSDED
jgi:hypothetical protein